ncbi:MAG TPA: MFS transporter [Candidatus Dormibacteraeota bacterium]|nr:MFS transporter [Candidatus Dormibacteraeota bacterium]
MTGGTVHPRAVTRAQPRLGWALAVIATAQLMVVLDATIVNVALPSIQRALRFSATDLEWVINAYAVAFGGLLLLGGRAGDLFGRRRVFVVGMAIFTLGSLAGGLALDATWLVAARALQGVGGAVASPTALSAIADTFPEGPSRNRAMGVYSTVAGAGGAIGLLLGGVLTQLASWRWILFVNVPIGLALILLAPRVLAASEGRPGRLDLPGAVTASGGMALLVYGLARAAAQGWNQGPTVLALAIAGGLLVAFVGIEARSPHALMPLRVLANRDRAGAYLIMLALAAAVFSMFFFLTQFVQNVLGFTPLMAGVAFLPISLGIVLTTNVTSRVVGRIGIRPPLTLGPLLAASGLLWLSRIDDHVGYLPGVLAPVLLLAVGMGMSFVPLTLSAVSRVPREEVGLASGLLNAGQQVGGSVGLALLVTVASAVSGSQLAGHGATSEQALTAGYARAFQVGALIAFGAFLIAVAAIRGPAGARRSIGLGLRARLLLARVLYRLLRRVSPVPVLILEGVGHDREGCPAAGGQPLLCGGRR